MKRYICLGAVFLIYLSIVYIFPKKTFWIIDGGDKFLTVQNLVKKNHKDFSIEYSGKDVDSELKYFPMNPQHTYTKDGRFFSVFPFIFPWASSFLYQLFSYSGLYIIPIISSIILLIVSAKVYKHIYDSKYQWAVILIIGLCSPVFFYSLAFWEMTLSSLIATSTIFFILKFISRQENRYLILGGITAGLSIWVRTDGYLFSAAIAIGLLFLYGLNKKNFLFIIAFIITISPLWILNHNIYGHFLGVRTINLMELELIKPFSNANFITDKSLLSVIKNRAGTLFEMLFQSHEKNTYSFLLSIPFIIFLFLSLKSKDYTAKYALLIAAMAAVLLSEGIAIILAIRNKYPIFNTFYTQGLFLSLPYAIFSFSGITTLFRKKKNEEKIIYIVIILYILFFSLINPGKGGIIWGPRFFFSIIPILIILFLGRWQNFSIKWQGGPRKKIFNILIVLLLLLSLCYQIYGIKLLHNKKIGTLYMLNNIKTLSHKHIITDIFWLSEEMSSIFYEKVFFRIENDNNLIGLISRLKEKGINRFSIIVSPFYSNVIDFDYLFGNKLYGLMGLTFKLVEESRQSVRYQEWKSHEVALINYSILDTK